jgi:RNA recognition motif-containing protein
MNVYVGNLSLETSEDELRDLFTAFGVVTDVVMMDDRYFGSGQTTAYAYVQMALPSAAVSAIASLNGTHLNGRTINVIEALPLTRRKEEVHDLHNSHHRFNKAARQRSN